MDKILTFNLLFDKEKIDEESKKLIPYFSIKSKIPSTEQIPIYFTVPNSLPSLKKNTYTLKGKLNIKVESGDIEPLDIEFTFNVIFLPLEIFFINGSMFWDENKLSLKIDSFKENEAFDFQYNIRNFIEDYLFFNNNYSLKSIGKNEVINKPIIIQNKSNLNLFKIVIPSIYKKQELLEGLFKIYFTNKMNIPLELSGKIKKPEFKVFFYDLIYNKIEENSSHLYLYRT